MPSNTYLKRLWRLSELTACMGACLLPLSSHAGDVSGRVLEVATYKGYGNTVFIRMEAAQNPLGCSTIGFWHYTLPMTSDADKRSFAMLLTAQLTGKTVLIYGSSTCLELPNIESALGVRMLQ